MPDRIDPGPGWRLLEAAEIVEDGDEYLLDRWRKSFNAGCKQNPFTPYRRRITSRTTKAIATRATVRASFPDGAMISDSIACESGLSMEMMGFFMDRWSSAKAQISTQVSPARYITLEIQREGEP